MRGDVVLVYFARCVDGTVKIGSTIDGNARRNQLHKLQPEFLFGFYVSAYEGRAVERVFHRHFDLQRVGSTEQFRFDDAALLEARSLPLWRTALNDHLFCECHGLTRHRAPKGWEQRPWQRVLMMRVTPKPYAEQWERMPSVAQLSIQ